MKDEEKQSDGDEERFNETLKRMLKTPPKPHTAEPSARQSRRLAIMHLS
ncbi:MAG: hypothetical protein KGL39_44205 [Patescibacteria group bacterium]|nr:hypothetical protein [Patescibacteria group bacterium]